MMMNVYITESNHNRQLSKKSYENSGFSLLLNRERTGLALVQPHSPIEYKNPGINKLNRECTGIISVSPRKKREKK